MLSSIALNECQGDITIAEEGLIFAPKGKTE
jgi:hypothetical protein